MNDYSGSNQCPVLTYKHYRDHRPPSCCEPDSRFYLTPLQKPKDSVWFAAAPMGKNSICNIAKKMALDAGLQEKNKTNHSARKTTVQTLLHANVPPTDVVQLTGHRNTQSLNSYSHMSAVQQKSVSHLLSKRMSQGSEKITSQSEAHTSNVEIAPAIDIQFSDQFELDI